MTGDDRTADPGVAVGEHHWLHATATSRPCRRLARLTGVLGYDVETRRLLIGNRRLGYGDMLTVVAATGEVRDALGHLVAKLGERVAVGGGGWPDDDLFHIGSVTREPVSRAGSRVGQEPGSPGR